MALVLSCIYAKPDVMERDKATEKKFGRKNGISKKFVHAMEIYFPILLSLQFDWEALNAFQVVTKMAKNARKHFGRISILLALLFARSIFGRRMRRGRTRGGVEVGGLVASTPLLTFSKSRTMKALVLVPFLCTFTRSLMLVSISLVQSLPLPTKKSTSTSNEINANDCRPTVMKRELVCSFGTFANMFRSFVAMFELDDEWNWRRSWQPVVISMGLM